MGVDGVLACVAPAYPKGGGSFTLGRACRRALDHMLAKRCGTTHA